MKLKCKQISLNNSPEFWVTFISINWIDRVVMFLLRLRYQPFHQSKYAWIKKIYGEQANYGAWLLDKPKKQ